MIGGLVEQAEYLQSSGMAIKEPSGSWTARKCSPCAKMAKCWIKVKNPKAPAMLRIVEGGW